MYGSTPQGGINASVEKKSPLKKSFNPGNESTASASLSGNRGELNYLFCKGNHRASECQVVTNIDETREVFQLPAPWGAPSP